MQVITKWTGAHADALREAMRMTSETFAECAEVSVRTVAGWRKRPEMTPRAATQDALDQILDHASDRVKAHFAMLVGESVTSNRTDSIGAVKPSAALSEASLSVTVPEFGDSEYLLSVHSHIQKIVGLDNRFGGADLVKLSARFFRGLHDQLGAGTYDPKLERDLQSAAGELAEVVGWLAYDAEAHDLVRRMNQESLYFARLAGDRNIELLTLQNSSMHAGAQGRPREALQIARSVLEGDYRLSPRLKALFLTRKARALAQSGDVSALYLLPEIRNLFLDGVSSGDPAWAWWVDERELAWHEAMIERDLGLENRAITQFERSVVATQATEVRSQYLHRAYLFESQVDNETWGAAEQTARELVPLATEVASTRTVVLLRNALRRLASHAKVPSTLEEQAGMLSVTLDEVLV